MKSYKVKNRSFDVEPHEIFLDTMAQKKEDELGISEIKFEVPLSERMSHILFGIFLVIALVLFSKTFYLQAVEGKKLLTQAENNKGSASLIMPERGIIYDKNLKKLVINSPAYDLVCDRAKFSVSTLGRSRTGEAEKNTKQINDIAVILGKDYAEIESKIINADSAEALVAENISHENLLVLETKINDITGCKIQQNTKRGYVYGSVFSQILGYTGRINKNEYSDSFGYLINDIIGKDGLEKQYESYLRGTPGQSKSAKERDEVDVAPISGNNLILNIDANLQKKIYESLEKSIKNIGSKKGAAVAMNPKTGAVLALVSYPAYDDNMFSGGISYEDYNGLLNDPSQPLFNRVLASRYPTGSTIKPFEALAALQEKLISPEKEINDIGYIEVKSVYDPSVVYRFGGVTPHGWVDMRKALAVSSNIYFYTIGGGYGDQKGLGPTRIKKYLSLFGWGTATGIDLPGEVTGFIPDPEWKKKTKGANWTDGDTYNLSIGQSDLQVTPLQLASAYCAIANGGTLYKPQILNKVIGPLTSSAQPIKEFFPEIIRSNFIDEANLKIVQEGMRMGVTDEEGSSFSLNNLPVDVASKTGTAEIGREGVFQAWIASYAPYEDPEIVFVATIENVEGLRAATLPVAKEVLEWYFSKQ